MLTEEQGIKAIIALQKIAGITESEEHAKRGWSKLDDYAKEQTEIAHKIMCGGFPKEEDS